MNKPLNKTPIFVVLLVAENASKNEFNPFLYDELQKMMQSLPVKLPPQGAPPQAGPHPVTPPPKQP